MLRQILLITGLFTASVALPCLAQQQPTLRPRWVEVMGEEARNMYPSASAALKHAQNLDAAHGKDWPKCHWYDYLPPCPNLQADIDPNDWVQEPSDVSKVFHPGAVSYRSKRYFRSPIVTAKNGLGAEWHGQQGCYKTGALITNVRDSGVGSPDFSGPSRETWIKDVLDWVRRNSGWDLEDTQLARKILLGNPHFRNDVATFLALSKEEHTTLKNYVKYWKPQSGTTIAFHVLVGRSGGDVIATVPAVTPHTAPTVVYADSPFVDGIHPRRGGHELENKGWRDTLLEVNAGDTIVFAAEGEVVWGEWHTEDDPEWCGPDGDPNTKNLLKREWFSWGRRPFPKELVGTLIGAIVSNDNLPAPDKMPGFKIGKRLSYTAPKSGRLWLGINDAVTSNNSGHFDVEIHRIPAVNDIG